MKRIVLLLVTLFVVFLSTGCGPSDAEKRAQQVAQAKDDALKLRQQLAQAKSGADAEKVRQQIIKVLTDANLSVESIHFTEAELKDYVQAASAAETPAPPPPTNYARRPCGHGLPSHVCWRKSGRMLQLVPRAGCALR